ADVFHQSSISWLSPSGEDTGQRATCYYTVNQHAFQSRAFAFSIALRSRQLPLMSHDREPAAAARSIAPRMTATERRATAGLAGIFGLRMLGMFIVLPVLALYTEGLPGGRDHRLVGLALGAYGLTQ